MPNVEEVIANYIERRNRIAEITKRHAEELKPMQEAQEAIETWLLHQANQAGVKSFKTDAGTAFKTEKTSVKMVDPGAFKRDVFDPAVSAIYNHLTACGYALPPTIIDELQSILAAKSKWDMVDFRVGKSGVQEYLEQTNALPPGVAMDSFTVMQVRKA